MSAGIQIVLTSFGYLHGGPPRADVTVDVREVLRDPQTDPAVRQLTGRDLRVRDRVLATAGGAEMAERLARLAEVYLMLRSLPDEQGQYIYTSVAVGCADGRHRSVALVEHLAVLLRAAGWWIEVEHRDVDKPVVRPALSPTRRELPPGGAS